MNSIYHRKVGNRYKLRRRYKEQVKYDISSSIRVLIDTYNDIENGEPVVIEIFRINTSHNRFITGFCSRDLLNKLCAMKCEYCGHGGTLYMACKEHIGVACITCHEHALLIDNYKQKNR